MTNARAIILAGALIALGIAAQPVLKGAAVTPAVAQGEGDLAAFADYIGDQHRQTMTGLEQLYDRLGETNALLERIAEAIEPAPAPAAEAPRAQRR